MNIHSIPVVAIALSIVICWSLFSLFCSFVHEAIVQIKAERGRYMRKYMFKQFYDQPNGVNWASLLYLQGSVELLTRSVNKPTSDINSRLFAETLIEVVGKAHITQMNKQSIARHLPYNSPLLNDFKAATLCLQQSDLVGFFQQSLSSAELCTNPDGTPDEAAIYKCLVHQIETWYNQMMERLSLWYRKRTKMRLFLLGTVLAFILNVDSIRLFRHFTAEPASRKVMMEYYQANAERLNELVKEDPAKAADYKAQLIDYGRQMDSLAIAAALPVGWEQNLFNTNTWKVAKEQRFGVQDPLYVTEKGRRQAWAGFKHDVWIFLWGIGFFLLKMPGYLISGFAVSAGAPFWFDVLKKAYSAKIPKQ